MRKIALISTYCDTQEKKDVFFDLVKKVKSYGVDVIAISPLSLEKEYIEACDFFYFTKENPVLSWPLRLFTFWRQFDLPDGRITTLQRGVGDYGWAALYQIKRLTRIMLGYDYDVFYHMIYDLEVDEEVEKHLKNFEGNILFPRRNPHNYDEIWETTLHFMAFNRDLMETIEKDITMEGYLSTNGVAEGEALKWKNKFRIKVSEHPVKDKIYYWKDHDFFDYSPFKEFKLFVSKNDDMDIWVGQNPPQKEKLPQNLRVLIYGYNDVEIISFVLNGKNYYVEPKSLEFIELDILSKDIESFIIKFKNQEFDFTQKYKEVMVNQIYYNFR